MSQTPPSPRAQLSQQVMAEWQSARHFWRTVLREPGLWSLVSVYAILLTANIAWFFPPLSSDEVLEGLNAYRILRGEWPIFSGFTYVGSAHAYLDALLVAIFGPSDWVLRVLPAFFKIAQLAAVYCTLRILYASRFAVAGTLLAASWTFSLQLVIVQSFNYSMTVFLWSLCLFLLVHETRFSEHRLCVTAGLGFGAGLAVWNNPHSLVPVLSILLIFAVKQLRLKKLGPLVLLSCAVAAGNAPFLYHNLVSTSLGTFRENTVALPVEATGTISLAVGNWRFYLTQVLPNALTPQSLSLTGLAGEVPRVLVAIGVICVAVALVLSLISLFQMRRLSRSAGPSSELLACLASVAVVVMWLGAIAFSHVGSFRVLGVERYCLSLFAVQPVLFVYALTRLSFGRFVPVLLVVLVAAAPGTLDWLWRYHYIDVKRVQLEERAFLRKEVARTGAKYVCGNYWDVNHVTFWTREDVLGIVVGDTLRYDGYLNSVLTPRLFPERGPGLLFFRRGSPLESAYKASCRNTPLSETHGPNGVVLVNLPLEDPHPVVAAIEHEIALERQLDLFGAGSKKAVELLPRLFTSGSVERNGAEESLVIDKPGFLAYGPYWKLPPGSYRVGYELNSATPASVYLDVAAGVDKLRIAWSDNLALEAGDRRCGATFTVKPGDRDFYQVRIAVTQTQGPVKLLQASLRRE